MYDILVFLMCGEVGRFASQCTQSKKGFGEEGEEKRMQPQQNLKTKKWKMSNSWLPQLESFLEFLRTNTLCSWIQRKEPRQVGT